MELVDPCTRPPVRVGVIDSGWDRRIAEVRVEPGVGYALDEHSTVAWRLNDQDRVGHGTACADLILQIAPDARIVPIRIFGDDLETSPDALIAAIEWATRNRLPVVNLSVGTRREDVVPSLYRVCEIARASGTTIVAAAGRSGDMFPAVFDPVIGVVMCPPSSDRFRVAVSKRNGADFEASGVQRARVLRGDVELLRGASFAAPVVAGRVARILREQPDADIETLRLAIPTL